MDEEIDVLVCDKFGCKEQGAGGGDEGHSDAEQRDNGRHDCAKCDVVSVRELKILRHKVDQKSTSVRGLVQGLIFLLRGSGYLSR
jgi:hypothetical protein